jgi:hypothetical protein
MIPHRTTHDIVSIGPYRPLSTIHSDTLWGFSLRYLGLALAILATHKKNALKLILTQGRATKVSCLILCHVLLARCLSWCFVVVDDNIVNPHKVSESLDWLPRKRICLLTSIMIARTTNYDQRSARLIVVS